MDLLQSTDVTIRPFRQDDRERVQAFFDQMGPESRGFFNRDRGNERGAMAFFTDGPTAEVERFLAERNGRMIGYVFLFGNDRKVPWLGIAVSEDAKGCHLGTRLMEFAKNYALSRGKGGILLTTHQANLRGQALYEKSGYVRLGNHTSGEVLYFLNFGE